jgi:hypothetical protein
VRLWTPAEQAAHRRVLADAGLIPRLTCLPCLRGDHLEECQGVTCRCRCRTMLGPDGRLDPTAPAPREAVA